MPICTTAPDQTNQPRLCYTRTTGTVYTCAILQKAQQRKVHVAFSQVPLITMLRASDFCSALWDNPGGGKGHLINRKQIQSGHPRNNLATSLRLVQLPTRACQEFWKHRCSRQLAETVFEGKTPGLLSPSASKLLLQHHELMVHPHKRKHALKLESQARRLED